MPTSGNLDVVTVGETMAAFVRDGDHYVVTTAGAESNVAAGVAQLGGRSRWISRLGDDQLGHVVADSIAAHGVDVAVDWDPVRLTATCVKEVSATGTRMRYYRSTSPARRLDLLDLSDAGTAPWLHLTGVTPALSPEDCDVVTALLTGTRAGRASFDVNYRPVLWPDPATAADVLVPLARLADVILIGEDEAEALLGTADPDAVAAILLRRPQQELILKRGGRAATLVSHEGHVSEPARLVDVVDLTGAGDAFAAGYVTASVWGWDARGRLSLGHFLASRVVGVLSDIGPDVVPAELAELAETLRQPFPPMTGEAQR